MFYFNYFPALNYRNITVTNIFKRFDFLLKILKNDLYFETIECLEGETIEYIAKRIYGDESYSWLILLSNRQLNPFYANFKTESELMQIVKQKYGIHLYDQIKFLDNGIPLDDVDMFYYKNKPNTLKYKNVVPFTILNLEQKENESKKFIRIIKPEYIEQINTELYNSYLNL